MFQLAEVARVGLRDESLRERSEQEVLTLAGQHPETIPDLVNRYRERGLLPRLVEMSRRVDKGLDQAGPATALRLALARVLMEDMGQPGQALTEARDLLALQPENAPVRLLLAQCLEQEGDVEAAVQAYRHAIEAEASLVEAYRGLDRLLKLLGHPRLARAADHRGLAGGRHLTE